MQIRDLSGKITSQTLNESLAKKFGYRLQLDKFTESQLSKVQQKLAEQVSEFERTNSFDSVIENHEYQKNRAMLDVVRQAIKERALSPEEKTKREKYVKGMKKAKGEFKKRYGKRGEEVMYATASKMAKKESIDEAMAILRGVLSERTLTEGEEEKAALIMSSRDMVDKITGWLEDVSSMKAETMLDLVDSIRDELGSETAEQFSSTVKPALEDLYKNLEQHRTTMAQAVSILTGEEGPHGAPGNVGVAGMPSGDELGAEIGAEGPPAAGGEEIPEMPPEAEVRMKRESIEYSRKLGTILSSKKR
jgi:SUMO ligase MMS21 Smc5/6 complex component